MSALPLADGPAMYFGGAIMTFALPYGAFIAAAIALFYLFRARHSGPRLRWSLSSAAQVSSVITREPGPALAPEPTTVTSAATAIPVPAAAATEAPAPASATPAPAPGATDPTPANDGPASDSPPSDSPEGKDGEPG